MSDIAFAVQRVSKMYMLYRHPQDRLKQALFWRFGKNFGQPFWALNDISFEIKQGESVGIVGRNGSGKSTLLQILAGTLQPTTGLVKTQGRVAALLELGSGFNPEYTGRENVLMNGTILGLSPTEIDACFPEIVAFADIGDFIDQPVKLYSSGMVVRLAFAVQAVVQKDILIVDEALAVGDEAFQRKCYAKLEEFRHNGGTVLLVTHNTQTVVRQCQRCLLLSEGNLLVDGDAKSVTDLYQKLMFSTPQIARNLTATLRQQGLAQALQSAEASRPIIAQARPSNASAETPPALNADWFDPNMAQPVETTYGNGDAEIFDFGLYNFQNQRVNIVVMGEVYEWRYKTRFFSDTRDVHLGMLLKTVDGLEVAGIYSYYERVAIPEVPSKTILQATFSFQLNIAPGTYFLNSGVSGITQGRFEYLHRRVDIAAIRVLPRDLRQTYGVAHVRPLFSYETVHDSVLGMMPAL